MDGRGSHRRRCRRRCRTPWPRACESAGRTREGQLTCQSVLGRSRSLTGTASSPLDDGRVRAGCPWQDSSKDRHHLDCQGRSDGVGHNLGEVSANGRRSVAAGAGLANWWSAVARERISGCVKHGTGDEAAHDVLLPNALALPPDAPAPHRAAQHALQTSQAQARTRLLSPTASLRNEKVRGSNPFSSTPGTPV